MSVTSTTRENRNIKIGVVLSLLSFVISMVVNVVFIKYINNPDIAGQSQYGLYTFSTSMTSLLLALSFGMTSSYIRFATIAKKENGEEGLKRINGSFAILFFISSILAAIIGVLIILAFNYGLIGSNYDETKRGIIVACISFSVANVVVSLVGNIFTLYTNFNMRFIWARVLTITVSILTPSITSIIIFFNHNIVTYVCVELGVNLLALLVNMIFCIKALKYKIQISFKKADFHILKSILVFSFFIFLVTAVTELTSSTPKMLLGLFPNPNGDSEITVAYYQLSATFIGAIAVASSAVSSTYVPLVNRYVAYGNNDDVNYIFTRATKNMIAAYAFVMGGFIACGKQFIILWQGSHYENTNLIYYIACLLSIISFIPSTFGITSEVQRAKNKHHFRSFVLLIGFAVNFIVSFLFLMLLPNFVDKSDPNYYSYQVIACAVGYGVGNIVNAVVMSIYNQKVIKLNMVRYYKMILGYLLMVAIPLALVFVLFYFLPLNLGLVWEMVARGVMFIILFVILLFVFDKNFIVNLFKKSKIQDVSEKVIKLENDSVDTSKRVYVFKEFYSVINDVLAQKTYRSLFENETMKQLQTLNNKYGAKFVLLFTKEINIRKVPKFILKDIANNSSWLSVAFSSGKHYPYSFVDAPFITSDLNSFASLTKKHDIKIETIVFPDFSINDTQLNYFKNFYGFRINGYCVFDNEKESKITVKKNLLLIPCSNYKNNNGGIMYFDSSDISSMMNNGFTNNSSIDELIKDALINKSHPVLFDKKVAVINTYNRLSTGRLAKAIMDESESIGLTTKLFYGRLYDESDNHSYYFGTSKIINFINNVYVKLTGNIGHAHYFETKKLIKKLNEYNPDIVHLHNIGGNCLNYGLLFDYLKDKKTIITMHDCFWLTGRCHHFTYSDKQCDKWKTGCGNCPHLDFYMKTYFFDKSAKLFKEKRNFINECKKLKMVCISKWQKAFFDESGVSGDKIRLIYNGIPTVDLNVETKSNTPRKLIFVSSYLTKDKGIEEINQLADKLDESSYEISVIGQKSKIKLNKKIKYLGSLNHKDVLKRIGESDLFIYPTHADTLPTVLIESLMVGTPIISYEVGGCSDVVGDNGIIVKYGDFDNFVKSIIDFDFSSFNRQDIIKKARNCFSEKKMVDEYVSLYEEVINDE